MRWGGKIGLSCDPHPDLPWAGEGLALGEQVTQTEKVFVRGFRDSLAALAAHIRATSLGESFSLCV